jgi:hypothetical protein
VPGHPRAHGRILGVPRDLAQRDGHRRRVEAVGLGRPRELEHRGERGVRAALHDPRGPLALERRLVLVPRQQRGEARPAAREGAVVGQRLVGERQHRGAPGLAEALGLGARGVVGRQEDRAPERRPTVRRGVVHHDADEPHAHRAAPGRAHLDHVRDGQRRLEAAYVRAEARGLELAHARAELLGRDVVLVVAEHGVREAERVHAVDHAPPRVEAREHARRDEIAGHRHEEPVGGVDLARLSQQRGEPRQVLEGVDVVHRHHTERGAARRGRGGGATVGHRAWLAAGSAPSPA